MTSQSKRSVAHPGTPTWGHPTGWALWRLSLVLAEIASQGSLEPSVDFREVRNRAKPALKIANRINRKRSKSKGGRKRPRTS